MILSACRSEKPVVPSDASLIDGMWRQECQAVDTGAQSRSIDLHFQFGKKFERQEHYFLDSDCQQAAFQLSYEGRYELTVTWQSYEYLLDFWVEDSRIESQSPAWVVQANAEHYCGRDDWDLGLRDDGDLQEVSCPLQFLTNSYHKNLIAVTPDRLLFAAPFAPGVVTDAEIDEEQLDLLFVKWAE